MFARQAFRSAQPLKQVRLDLILDYQQKLTTVDFRQSFRKYSAEAAPKKSNLTPIYIAVGLAGLGAGVYRYSNSATATAEIKERPKVFNGENWVDLKLASIENLSHNTKKLRFEFEDPEAVGGLPVACQ